MARHRPTDFATSRQHAGCAAEFSGCVSKSSSFCLVVLPHCRAKLSLARYADSDGNFVLVVSGSFEANNTKKLVEIVYDPLIEAIQLGSLVMLKFGVGPVGLK